MQVGLPIVTLAGEPRPRSLGEREECGGTPDFGALRCFSAPVCRDAIWLVGRLLWSAVASPIPRLRTTPIFKGRLQQEFASAEMGYGDQFSL
jgi:hypothetical protein